MKKICPQCGKEFICKHDSECFCMRYSINKDNLKILKEKFSDCLCENCLKQYADKDSSEHQSKNP
ncbi:MAG: cysteine-rich CWC family protein [Bacteroidales bacterium]|nr:cysteine-rich CWC family protein [Bacteroidales bacterium]